MIGKYIRKYWALIIFGFILSVLDATLTVAAIEHGGRELMLLANYFLQFGYGSLTAYLVGMKMVISFYIILSFCFLQVLFNKYAQRKGFENSFLYGEKIVISFIPLGLICSNIVSIAIVWSNLNLLFQMLN